MELLVVVVEVLGEAGRGQVFDLCVEHVRHGQPVLLEHVEEEDQLVLPLLAIVDVLLELHQQLPQVDVLLVQLVDVVLLLVVQFWVEPKGLCELFSIHLLLFRVLPTVATSHGLFEELAVVG